MKGISRRNRSRYSCSEDFNFSVTVWSPYMICKKAKITLHLRGILQCTNACLLLCLSNYYTETDALPKTSGVFGSTLYCCNYYLNKMNILFLYRIVETVVWLKDLPITAEIQRWSSLSFESYSWKSPPHYWFLWLPWCRGIGFLPQHPTLTTLLGSSPVCLAFSETTETILNFYVSICACVLKICITCKVMRTSFPILVEVKFVNSGSG